MKTRKEVEDLIEIYASPASVRIRVDSMLKLMIEVLLDIREERELVWTGCIFQGPPPLGYYSWSEYLDKSTAAGLFTGVILSRQEKERQPVSKLPEGDREALDDN